MDQTEPQRQFYMQHDDSPERRLRNKNPASFWMDWQEIRGTEKEKPVAG